MWRILTNNWAARCQAGSENCAVVVRMWSGRAGWPDSGGSCAVLASAASPTIKVWHSQGFYTSYITLGLGQLWLSGGIWENIVSGVGYDQNIAELWVVAIDSEPGMKVQAPVFLRHSLTRSLPLAIISWREGSFRKCWLGSCVPWWWYGVIIRSSVLMKVCIVREIPRKFPRWPLLVVVARNQCPKKDPYLVLLTQSE